MNNNEEMIDQSVLAQDVSEKIKYEFLDYFLVKPLDPVKVTKEFSKPVAAGKAKEDENGVEAQDFDEVETEVKEVDSDFRKGIILKRPTYYESQEKDFEIKIGDVAIFRETAGIRFDLIKDSRLLRQFDILGVVQQ